MHGSALHLAVRWNADRSHIFPIKPLERYELAQFDRPANVPPCRRTSVRAIVRMRAITLTITEIAERVWPIRSIDGPSLSTAWRAFKSRESRVNSYNFHLSYFRTAGERSGSEGHVGSGAHMDSRRGPLSRKYTAGCGTARLRMSSVMHALRRTPQRRGRVRQRN